MEKTVAEMVSTVLFRGVGKVEEAGWEIVDSMVYNVLFRGVSMVDEAVGEVATVVSLRFSAGQMSSSNTSANSG